MESFVAVIDLAELHVDWREDDDLVPGYEHGPRQWTERWSLELQGHSTTSIHQHVKPLQIHIYIIYVLDNNQMD